MKVRIEVTFDAETAAGYMRLDGHGLHVAVCSHVRELLKDGLYLSGIEVKNIVVSHSYAEAAK